MYYRRGTIRPAGFALGGKINRPIFTTLPIRPVRDIIQAAVVQPKPAPRIFQK